MNAHYTDADLVRSVWGAVRNLGFRGGRVLEPGSGSGNFIGFSPILLRDPVRMTGVEVEPVTAQIARHLYPDAEIVTSGLEEVELADGGFDAVVGNVPYGRYARFDKVHNKDLALSIHDHFVLKSLYATRPGGVVALITSRYTMDAVDPGARARMYELGDLVGAVRLPARAHATAAGTDVVTDVLFLRRRMPGEEPGDDTWLTSTKRQLPGHENELAVNTYFDAHPEYVLGELRAGSREWGPEVTVVGRTDQAPAQALASAAAAITVEARAAGLTAADDQRTAPVATIVTSGTEGALGLDSEGNPTIIDGGRPIPLEVHPDQREQLLQLIRLKGLTLDLYELEAATDEPGETPDLARLRAELRVAWRDYRKTHPPLTKPRQHFKFTPAEARAQATAQGLKDVPEAWKHRTAFAWIDDDPDASLLFGLEEWDDRSGKGIEQKVLRARVLEPRILPVRANSHEDAVALAMEYDGGRLDMSRVASLLGLDEESAAAQIADAGLAYRDPQQSDAWEPGHRYLSGNVRTKLAAARERAAEDPTFQGNVAALERVQPSDLAPSEIKAKIGAPWVPVDVYNDFLASLGFEDASVVHAGGTVWEVRGAKNGDLARTEWGTGSRPTQDLFTALLRQTESTIQVTWRDKDGHTFVDKEATDAAQEKAKLIAEAFEDWIWDDETRAARLAKIYNHQFNNLVLPEYSPAALTLPGLISDWTMKEHQNAAIRRIVNEPTALLAHVVGAGKTATMAAGAMELRRTGLAQKPCLIVPNHMLKQWSREFRQLYPNAKILAITASDLGKKRRAKFMGRIAGGEWDAVILTHDAFTRVPVRPDTQRAYLDREMRSLREQLDAAAEAGMARNTVKQIEESLANAEAKLQQQIDSMDDEIGVFLEDTGIDYVFLDEAHEFKNLRTVSAIPGAAIQGSAKATKLHMVLDHLRATNESERVATLATGTPIANSVTEAYVLKRYLAPQLLEEMGLDAFDNWAATFGEVVSNLEPDPKGDGYKYKARFSRFFNVPELMAGYRTFADVQMAEDLNLPTPPVRENEDGQRGEYVLIPPTPAQRQFIKELPHQPWVRKPGGVLKALGEGLRASVDLDLVDATEALRNLGLNITADKVMSDDPVYGGRVLDMEKVAELADAAATDMRSLGGTKEMGSKIPSAAEKIAEIWQETKDIVYPVSGDDPTPQELPGGLQLVFLDEGTPGSTAKHAANLYQDLRDELVARGMPRESIRFIHEAGTDRKKEKLFADCRAGRVRVLVGSTQKMGTGTNIQDRSVALHHLSYPWRPADMAQRDGRIERRGNLNAPWIDNTPDDVRILYYITERTFDEFRLTTLARKARFIGQIQRRDFSAREIEDIGADAINLGMLSALASGDPAILQLAEATAERARLQGLARSWDRQQDTRSQQLTDIDDFLARADTALEGMRAAAPNRRPTTGDAFAMTVDDATYRSRDTAANALGARMAAIAADQSIRPGERVPIGTFGNQDFHAEIAYGASGRRQLRLRFAWGNVVPIGHREDRAQWQASSVTPSNGRGAIQSLEHFLNNLDSDLEKLDASVISSRARREEIAGNLRPKDENPYRIQARSKEREERALGKLVVANEKEAALAERVERAASVNEDAAEEVNEELTTLREHIASLRQSIADEHDIQARAQGLVQDESRSDDAPTPAENAAHEAIATAMAEALLPDGSTEPRPPATSMGDVEKQGSPPAEPQDPNPAPEPRADPPADGQETPEPERSPEQQFQEAVDELFPGTVPVPEEPGPYDLGAGEHDPVLAQMIAQDAAAMSGEGWTEVVQPFASQREATFEQNHVDVVYERWAATQTALPMLVDAEGELTDEEPGITNPAGLVASWHHRSRVAAATAGPTGGRMVVEQFEGLAQAALRADGYLAERDAYASEEDRALLLQLANVAGSYARRLAVTLDVLAQQRTDDRQESQANVRMREVQALESAMEYLGAQGADFRMDRRNTTITDREAAGAQLRDDLLQTMREIAELPLERQNTDPDARVLYGHIRGIPLYFGWGDTTGSQAQVVLGFDQLPLLEPISITAAELEAMSPAQLIDHIDGRLGLDALSAVRDRERAAIQELLAAGAQEQQSAPADQPAPATTDPIAELQRQSLKLNDWWLTSSDVAVPEGHQPFSDATVDLVAGDQVRIGSRQYMEDRHLHYHTVTVQSGPDRSDGYYLCTNADGIRRRFHPRNIVAVPDGSRLLAGNAPAPEQTATPEPAQHQETTEQEPQEHSGPSPEWARIAAVLRYYEPLLQRHKLSGRETVAFLDRPGAGYRYEPGNPLSDLMADIAKAGERAGGSYRISYNEWVNYSVGERRQQQSDTLINLSIDLMTLHSGETEPLFLVDLEAILAAPPGTVVELPSEAELAADDAAAARIVINHDAEGTDVRNTPPGGAEGIREALKDLGFSWSRRQQKWYQRRDTPFEDRDTAVRGLRAAFEKLGVAYTYNGPEQAPQGGQEAAEDTQTQTADTAGPQTAPPGQTPADTPTPDTGQDGEPDTPAPDTTDPDERQTQPDPDGTEQPAPPAAAHNEDDAPAPDADPDAPEETEETSAGPEAAPALIVQTPDGPGTVIGSDGDLVLVSTASGTRVWEAGEVQWPDGAARPENTDQAAKKRQNAADAEQATTAEGIELQFGGGNRLVDLDPEAGHGTVVDADGTVIGWVRARTGDDGRRYWWGQDARGGAPDGSPFHEELPPSAGVPAIRAAGRVRSGMVRATEPEHRHPTTVEYAAREVRLTTAQVRELRQLTLTATYSDGSAIEPPEWVGAHRRYFLNVAQIRALGEAAQAAAAALPGATAEERRTARVLRNAAERFDFEAYDTARWRATIPPIGEIDPYAGPYQPRPRTEEAAEQPDATVPAAERSATATDDDNQALPFVVDDEFSILYAAYRDLLPAGVAIDELTQDNGRIPIGDGGVHADAAIVERLLTEGLLERGTNATLGLTDTGRQRLRELERAGRAEPAVGDRVLLVGSGNLGIVGGYKTTENGIRIADVVSDREGWPNGWDTNVGALFMTTVEPAAMDPAAAAERYRVAALRQFPGTLTDPALRASALEALTAAALADPQVAQAAHANDLNNFVVALAARTRGWMTDQWENTEPEQWPDWVRAYFRQGDQAVDHRNGLYSELAGPIYRRLRAPEPDPAPVPTPAAPAPTEREASGVAPAGQAEPDLVAAAQDVGPAPHWRIVGAESDEQAAARFGGNDLMLAFAARVQAVPAPSALTDTSADVWMDGRMVGWIIDVNDAADFTGPGGAPLWSAEPVFGTSDERLARFRSRDAALAELAVRALRTGPPALDRLDDDMVASFTRYLTPPLPDATSDDAVSTARLAELTAVLDAFAQGRSLGSSIAEDLVLAHDSLLWLAATQPDVQVRDDLETRADTIRGYLNVFRPGDPRAAQNWAGDQPSETVPAPAPAADPVPGRAEDGEEGQLDLFPAETPDTPAPQRRPARRRGGRGKEPAIPPRTEGGPEDGRTGVYGHADHGECERCGNDTSRYTVVWQWHSSDHGAMAAECASCVELTLGLPYAEIARLADLAEARRGGERIQPRPHPEGFDVVTRRTADKEFTSIHLPTGKRYRQAQESPSGYRGYVTRDLYGISHGTTVGLSDSVARRAALGHTAETHPNSSDAWVLFSYRQDLKQVLLHDGETVVSRGTNPRNSGVFENGPRWDMTISGTAYVVEMVYQTGPVGDDGHRLEVTAPDQSSTRHVHWDGALEWAREHTRTTGTATANVPAEELTTVEEATPPLDTAEPAQPELDLDLGTTGPDDEDDPEYEVSVPGEEPAATTTPEPVETPAAVPDAQEGPPADDDADEEAPERVRGPLLTLGLREGPDGQVVARVEANGAAQALVLPGISTADIPGLSLPVTVEIPMLVRAADLAEQLVSDDETAAWLGEHLPAGPLAAAWSSDRVRAVLIVVVRDSLREGMAPTVEDVATWLVDAAREDEGLLRAAHTADGPADFGPVFAAAADALITDGGSEHLLWTYLGAEGTRRTEVLALATPDAYTQLLALPAPSDAQTATPSATPDPPQDAPEESDMATPASPEEPVRGRVVPPRRPTPRRGNVAPPAPEPDPVRGYGVPPAPQQETAEDIDVQDPPEPQTFTTSAPLAAYPQHQVHLEGMDGTGYSRGELHRDGQHIATLQRTVGGQWYARMQLDPADITRLVDTPEVAAENGAVMYAAFTGLPLGDPMVAAPGADIQARAEQVRSELREFAAQHRESIEIAARQLLLNFATNPHYEELAARLDDVADSDGRGARMMAADLAGVERAVNAWGGTLPPSPNSEIRAALAFPLAHMLFDVRRLQERLQATVEVAEEERARQRAAAEPTPPAPEAAEEVRPVEEAPPAAPEPSAAVDSGTEPPVAEDIEPPTADAAATADLHAAPSAEEEGPEPETTVEEEPAAAEDGTQAPAGEPTAPVPDATDTDAPPEDPELPVQQETAPEEAAPAPLWGTDEVPVVAYADGEGNEQGAAAADPDDVLANFQGFREAWDDAVTAGVTSTELFDDVRSDLTTLQTLFAEAVSGTPAPEADTPPAEPDTAPERDEHQEAEAVNATLREADTRAESLQDLPEWQKIQTVRGALGHLLTTIRQRAGDQFDKLLGDKRASGFLRELSARACDKIADLAQAAARKLRGENGRAEERGGAPSTTEALLRLGDATTTFSAPRGGPGGTPPSTGSATDQPDIPAMRKMGEALAKPMPGARPKVSAAAARGRSTTTKRSSAKKPATDKTTEQAPHLRRGPDQTSPRKPQQR
ncbi:SNF2-related protein [Streptomyces sp. NPDC014891]|uniref:SNF2-related protein n=1 Tax=Streptomyces sp. NPDC014891 TaxID=3364929 RepID=UPI0036FADA1D